MSEPIRSYPLQWPAGWRRTKPEHRMRASFNRRSRSFGVPPTTQALSVMDAVARVLEQLRHMGVDRDETVISTNMQTRLDGLPRSNAPQPADPGVAVYWRRFGEEPRCMAIDRYDSTADNLAAIAATLDSMRAIERHGGAVILEKAFAGLVALPAPECWWQTLGLDGPNATKDEINAAYRRRISEHHPDTGGDHDAASQINRARALGLEAAR